MSTEVERTLAVGIGDLVVTSDPDVVLVAHGLGSCVAVIGHCRKPLVGGMLHVMLPNSSDHQDQSNLTRYADTGIAELVARLKAAGADPRRAAFKLVGGAAVLSVAKGHGGRFRVGSRNAEASQAMLRELGLRVQAEDLGGKRGRTVEFAVGAGRVMVRKLGEATTEL